MKAKWQVEYMRGVAKDIRARIDEFVRKVSEISPIRHKLRIIVVPHETI